MAVWECVGPNVGVRRESSFDLLRQHSTKSVPPRLVEHAGVWICTFLHSLPAPVDYALLSPHRGMVATISNLSGDTMVRIYKISFAAEMSPLREELGRSLGRSFSQNLEFFGASTSLEYWSLLVDGTPCKISWRKTTGAEESIQNAALSVVTAEGSEFIFVEDSSPRIDGNDQFALCIIHDASSQGEAIWWLHDDALENVVGQQCQLIGEANAALFVLPPNNDTFLIRVSGIDMAGSVMVSLDRLMNVSCTWNPPPKLTRSMTVLIRDNVAVLVDFCSSHLLTAKLSPSSMPFDGHGEPCDFNYDIITSLRPVLGASDELILSSSYPLGCSLSAKSTVLFAIEAGQTRQICSLPRFQQVHPSDYTSQVYGVDGKGHLFILAMDHQQQVQIAEPIDHIVGELARTTDAIFLFLAVGDKVYKCSIKGQEGFIEESMQLPRESEQLLVFGEAESPFAISVIDSRLSLFEWMKASECRSSIDIEPSNGVVLSSDSDAAFLQMGYQHYTLSVAYLTPSNQNLFSMTSVVPLEEEPLGIAWSHERNLYVALSNGLIRYSPGLDTNGSERWVCRGKVGWPSSFPCTLKPSSFAISVAFDGYIWIAVDGISFRFAPIQDENEDSQLLSKQMPDIIFAYRSINFAATDQFDRLDLAETCENSQQGRKTPCAPQEAFSFFDDVDFLDFNSDGDHVFEAEELGFGDRSSRSPLHVSLSSPSRTSFDATKTCRLRYATYEAAQRLHVNLAAVDSAGAKYLYFAKLSWEAADEACTQGFEYLAASMSDAQEVLIAANRELASNGLTWCKFGHFGMGFWIRNEQRLRELLEDVARTDFTMNKDPANCAILYLILGRRSILRTLWKAGGVADAEGSRMTSFLASDFEDEHVRSIAAKNAFAALAKQRNRLAIIFFILANRLDDALQVCFERLQDYHLGFLIARFLCDEANYNKMLTRHIRGNLRIPICIRGLMKKLANPETDILELIRVLSFIHLSMFLRLFRRRRGPSQVGWTNQECVCLWPSFC